MIRPGWVRLGYYYILVDGMEWGVGNGVSKHKRCRMLFEAKLSCVYDFSSRSCGLAE
jgi:hypothetical protein